MDEPRCWDFHGVINDWRLVSGQPPVNLRHLVIECSPLIKPSQPAPPSSSCKAATWKCAGKQRQPATLYPTMFFVRNNSLVVPRLEPGTWRLEVTIRCVAPRRSLTTTSWGCLSIAVIRAIECAGNGRSFSGLARKEDCGHAVESGRDWCRRMDGVLRSPGSRGSQTDCPVCHARRLG